MSQDLGYEKFKELREQIKPYTYKKKTIILYPTEKIASLCYLEEGYVRAYTISSMGDQRISVIHRPGDMFPFLSLGDGLKNASYYEAVTRVTLRKIPLKDIVYSMRGDVHMNQYITVVMLSQFKTYSDRVENLMHTHAYPRFISFLLFLAKHYGKRDEKGCICIMVPLTHRDVADSIAMTRETASRQFEKLEKAGLITRSRQLVTICDKKRLEEEIVESEV